MFLPAKLQSFGESAKQITIFFQYLAAVVAREGGRWSEEG